MADTKNKVMGVLLLIFLWLWNAYNLWSSARRVCGITFRPYWYQWPVGAAVLIVAIYLIFKK